MKVGVELRETNCENKVGVFSLVSLGLGQGFCGRHDFETATEEKSRQEDKIRDSRGLPWI